MLNCDNRYTTHSLIVYVIIGTVNYLDDRYAAIHSLSLHARWNLERAVLSRKRFARGYRAARRGALVRDGLARRAPDRWSGRRRSVDQQGWLGTPRPDPGRRPRVPV